LAVVHDGYDGEHHAEQGERVDRVDEQERPAKVPMSDDRAPGETISSLRASRRKRNTNEEAEQHRLGESLQHFRIRDIEKRVDVS